MKLRELFKNQSPPTVDHADFGRLVFDARQQCWSRLDFQMWGYAGLQLVIDAPDSGPTARQVAEYRRISQAGDQLHYRCLAALQTVVPDSTGPPQFMLSGLSIPRLDGSEVGELWNLWFDREGDGHYLFGVQTTDRWLTLEPYVGD